MGISQNAASSLINSATVSGGGDNTPANNTADDPTTVVSSANLSLTKTVSNSLPPVGSNITYTLTVTNAGLSNATGVSLTDLLPTGLSFVSSTPSQGTYDDSTGAWIIGGLNSSSSVTLQIVATVTGLSTISNAAEIRTSDQPDPNSTPGNGTANSEDDHASVDITPVPANLSLTKTHIGNFTRGGTGTYTIVVSNAGGVGTTTGVVSVTDTLPAGLTLVAPLPTGTGWTLSTGAVGDSSFTLTRSDPLSAASSYPAITVRVAIAQNAAGSVTNSATVSGGGDNTSANNTVNDLTGIVSSSDLSLTKTVSSTAPSVGNNVTYTLTVTNAGLSDATGIAVTDLLPAGLSFVSSNPSQGAYDASTGLWTVGALANTSSATLQIVTAVNSGGTITNAAQVTAADQPDPDSLPNNGTGNLEDDRASADITPIGADLSLTKTHNGSFTRGGSGVYTITVSNDPASSSTVGTVSVTDTLPAGLTLVAPLPSGTGWTLSTGAIGDSSFTLTRSDPLIAGSSYPAISATVAVGQNAAGSVTNSASVSGGGDGSLGNNTASDPTTIVSSSDLRLTKTVSPVNPNLGQTATYTLTVSNDGISNASGVIVNDLLPSGLSFTSSNPSQGTYAAGSGDWNVGSITSGSSATLELVATVTAGGSIRNSAEVKVSDQPDPNSTPGNGTGNGEDDQASVTTPLQVADLSLSKTVSNATPAVGSNVTYTLTVSNAGPFKADSVGVGDLLPAGLSFVSSNPSQGTYTAATGVWGVGAINNGSAASLEIVATVSTAGVIVNRAEVQSSDQGDLDSSPGNGFGNSEDDQASVSISPVTADLSLTKTHAGNFTRGGTGEYTLTVSNAVGVGSTVGTVSVTDSLPAGMTLIAPLPTGTGWTLVSGAVGATSFTLTRSDALSAGSSYPAINLKVAVGQISAASLTNTAVVSGGGDNTPNNNTADDPTALVSSSDLSLSKTVSTAAPLVGGQVTYTLTVANAGPSDATGVVVADALPTGLSFVSSNASQGAYNDATGQWLVGAIGSQTSATLQIVATVTGIGAISNAAEISASDQPDPNSTPGNGTANSENDRSSVDINPLPANLSLTKTHVGNFTRGSVGVYTIVVSNSAGLTTGTVSVTDTLPAGLTLVAPLPAGTGWTLLGGAPGDTSFTLTRADALPTASSYEAINVNVAVAQSAGNTITNTATVSGGGDNTPANNTANDPTGIVSSSDLSLAKTVSNATQVVGGNVTYTLTVTNAGPSDASGVTLRDALPSGLSFVSSSACTNTAGTLTCPVADIAANTSQAVSFVATVNALGTISNAAEIFTADQPDPDSIPGNGTGNVEDDRSSVDLSPAPADLSLTKTHAGNFTRGGNGQYTITVSNAASAGQTVGGVSVTDSLPAGLTLAAPLPSGTGWVLTNGAIGDSSFTLTRSDPLSTGSSHPAITVTVAIAQNAASSLINSASVSGGGDNTNANNTADDLTTIVSSSDLSLTKTVSSALPAVGSNVTYTLTVTNAGLSDATGIAVTDLLPGGMSFVSSNPSQGAYNASTGLWTIGALANTSSATLQIVATVTGLGTISNAAEISASDQPDADSTPGNGTGNAEDDRANADISSLPADLSLTKTHTGNFTRGSTGVYTIAVSNAAGAGRTVGAVSLTDTLPAGLTLAAPLPSGTGWTLSNGAVGDSSFTLTRSDTLIAASSYPAITITVAIAQNAAGSVTNSATVSGGGDNTTLNNTTDDSTGVVSSSDLSLTKTVSTPTVVVGGDVNYTLTVTNVGPSDASGVTLRDVLPAGLSFVSSTACTNTAGTLTCTVPNIAANTSQSVSFVARVTAVGTISNAAEISASDQPDPNSTPGNGTANSEDDRSNVNINPAPANLDISKTHTGNFTRGGTGAYTIVVSNAGGVGSTTGAVSVTDTLPAGMTLVAPLPTGTGWTLVSGAVGATSFTLTRSDALSAGSSYPAINLNVGISQNAASSLINSATVSGGGDNTPANNTADDPTGIVSSSDLSLTKTASNLTPVVGGDVTYTLTVTNAGPSDASGVTLRDVLPSGLSFVSSTDCTALNGNLNCAVPDVAAGSSQAVRFVVTVTSAGAILNSAEILNADQPDPDSTPGNGTGNTEDDRASVLISGQQADVITTKSAAATVNAGSTLTYTITVTNNGPADALNVVVTDTLPLSPALTNVSASGGATVNASSLTWTIPRLVDGQTQVYTVTGTAPSGGTLLNSVSSSADTFDPTPANNDGRAPGGNVTTNVNRPPEALNATNQLLANSAAPTTLSLGLNATDPDPGDAISSYEIVALPDPAEGVLYFSDGQTPVLAGQTLTPSQATGLKFQPNPAFSGNAGFSYTAADTQGFADATPATYLIPVLAPLKLSKNFAASSVAIGTATTLTITITNPNAQPVNLTSLSDFLPAGLELSAASNTCAGNAGINANELTLTGGSLAANSSCSLSATVTAIGTNGNAKLNTIPAGALTTNVAGLSNAAPASARLEVASIGAAKQLSRVTNNGDGTYTLDFTITVKNLGSAPLSNVQVLEDLSAMAGAATFTITAPPTVQGATQLSPNAGFTGTGNGSLELLNASISRLAVGASHELQFTVRINPNGNPITTTYTNTVSASASAAGVTTTDLSNNGANPDPNGNGNPNETGENTVTRATAKSG